MVEQIYADGVSIIVLSYERMDALIKNLTSIVAQEMDGVPLEIIVLNNSANMNIHPSRFTAIGRLLRQYPQIKVLNSSYNWRTDIRYGVAYSALYDTIMFIDDDIHLLDNRYVIDVYRQKQQLGLYDVVSCWNTLWTSWDENGIELVSASLLDPNVTELVRTDTCGPGISMFNRHLILDIRARNNLISRDFPSATDMVLGLLTNYIWGGTTYCFPAHKRVRFHDQHKQSALHELPDFISDRMKIYKRLWKDGYQPVLERFKDELDDTSPEMRLIHANEPRRKKW